MEQLAPPVTLALLDPLDLLDQLDLPALLDLLDLLDPLVLLGPQNPLVQTVLRVPPDLLALLELL